MRSRRVWIETRARKHGRTSYTVCTYSRELRRRDSLATVRSAKIAEQLRRAWWDHLNGMGPRPGAPPEDGPPGRPLTDAVTSWLDTAPIRPKTRSGYKSALGRFTTWAAGQELGTVEAVTEEHIGEYLGWLLNDQKLARSSCSGYLRAIAAFFRAVEPDACPITDRLIERWNPYRKQKKARPHYYPAAEFQALLDACESWGAPQVASKGRGAGKPGRGLRAGDRPREWWKALLLVLHHGGLRIDEAAHLIWRDIDFDKGIIRVQPHDGVPGTFPWRPKGTQRRDVPVPAEVLDALAGLQVGQPDGLPYCLLTPARYARLRAAKKLPRDFLPNVGKQFAKLRARAGIAEGTIHDMRRTFVTNWLKRLPVEKVRVLAGHQDIHTTWAIYLEMQDQLVVSEASELIRGSASETTASRAGTRACPAADPKPA